MDENPNLLAYLLIYVLYQGLVYIIVYLSIILFTLQLGVCVMTYHVIEWTCMKRNYSCIIHLLSTEF